MEKDKAFLPYFFRKLLLNFILMNWSYLFYHCEFDDQVSICILNDKIMLYCYCCYGVVLHDSWIIMLIKDFLLKKASYVLLLWSEKI